MTREATASWSKHVFCYPDGYDLAQLSDVTTKYLEDHPENSPRDGNHAGYNNDRAHYNCESATLVQINIFLVTLQLPIVHEFHRLGI